MTKNAFIYDYVRTPFGRYGKSLAAVRPDDLAASVISSLMERHPRFLEKTISEVVFGCANGAGEDNRNIARMASLLAGLPTSVPGVTVNRLCGSGMESIFQASRQIELDEAEIVIAGGVESMSRAPWVLLKPEQPFPSDHQVMHSTTLGWRMLNQKMDSRWTVPLGESAEILADMFKISREEQDEFGLRSHQLAAKAVKSGAFASDLVIPPLSKITSDENVRADANLETLSGLKTVFRDSGTVTAGNASPLSDGAAAILIAGEKADLGEPIARVVSRAATANDPNIFGIAPVEAANLALSRAGLSWSDIDMVEINEAFASQVLACLRLMPELDPQIVNPNGGAIAIGHPLGASGVRIVGQLARNLKESRKRFGLAAICIGVGQGLALVIEAV